MASTRAATGNSKPRIFAAVSTAPSRKSTAGTKKRATTKKTGAGITKKRAPAATQKRKPTLKDKVVGATEKVVGKVEGKPGKKAAGTKKMHGTDGKGARGKKVGKV